MTEGLPSERYCENIDHDGVEEECEPASVLDITDPTSGQSRLLSTPCETCVLAPGNRMEILPGALKDLIGQALAQGKYIICHDTLPYGRFPRARPAICRGFYDRYADQSLGLKLLQKYDRLEEVPPPAGESNDT